MFRPLSALVALSTSLAAGTVYAACEGTEQGNVWRQRVRNSVVHLEVNPRGIALSGHGVIVKEGTRLRLLAPLHLFIGKTWGTDKVYFVPSNWVATDFAVRLFHQADPAAKAVLDGMSLSAGGSRVTRPDLDLAFFDLPTTLSDARLQNVDVGFELSSGSTGPVCPAWFIGRDDTSRMNIGDPQLPAGPLSGPSRIGWKPSTNAANEHLSGVPLFDQSGRLAAITQYQDSKGYVATLVRELQTPADGGAALFTRIFAHSFVGSANVVSRHEGTSTRCSALTRLNDRLDELTQAGLDYQNRELILTFPDSYVNYIANVETAIPITSQAVGADASCGCAQQANVFVDAITLAARLQRRINAVAEFRKLTTEALFFPRRDSNGEISPSMGLDDFCSKLEWIVLPSIGLRISPLDRLMVCGLGKAAQVPTVLGLITSLFDQRVVDADVCGALPSLNSRLGWQLTCPTALDSWRKVANAVAPTLKWKELGLRKNLWTQVLLWKGAEQEGLVVGSSALVEQLSGVSAAALDQDAGINVEAKGTVTKLKSLTLGDATSPAVAALNDFIRQLDALPPELAAPFSAPVGSGSELFNEIVRALPDSEPVRSDGTPYRTARAYVSSLEVTLRRFQASLSKFLETSAKGLQAQCVGNAAAPPVISQTRTP